MEQLRPCLGFGFGVGWEEGIFLRTFVFCCVFVGDTVVVVMVI